MKLIVQIPAFNEETTIAQALRDVPKKIDGIVSIETLVIDDGSSDNTADAARRAGATHVVQLRSHAGLSAAFRAGIDAALRLGADIIVNTDADNQYNGADIARLVAPILKGTAEVVVGDRGVATSPHMSGFKRLLQRLGSWTVGMMSGISIADVTSGFRAFSREAALQINVFNPFTYTLETIIQAGIRNLVVQSVPVRTNAPARPSRLYHGIGTYLRKSIVTIFRVYMMYRPLKTFFAIGSVLMLAGTALGARFLWLFAEGSRGGHIQSLILAAVFLITGFHTLLVGLVADLISANRRLSEEALIRVKRLESPEGVRKARLPHERPQATPFTDRPQQSRRERPARAEHRDRRPDRPTPTPAAAAATQWVWLLDEEKLNDRGITAEAKTPIEVEDDEPQAPEPPPPSGKSGGPRRRRRRRGGVRQATDLPGNRGKHLGDSE
jgi:glycosyltransferase involved in cell wall biosynthesis